MKILWLYMVKAYLKLGLFFYFRSIQVHGLKNIPEDRPLMLLSNHQNALLDALLIATRIPGTAYYLTRAGVFKSTLVASLLKGLNMLPIYRIRDGFSNLGRNKGLFDNVAEKLADRETVVIFPEGSHNLARRVRPLSKGFTRIVFNTMDRYPDLDLQLLPVGVNYIKPKAFGDSAAIYFGEPIEARKYSMSDAKNLPTQTNRLKVTMQKAIGALTTDIPEGNYEAILDRLNDLQVDYLNPVAVNQCIASDFKNCETSRSTKRTWLRSFFKLLLILCIPIPYLIWKLYAQPKIKELEFTSTFRFAIAVTLVPIFMIIIGILLYQIIGLQAMLVYVVGTLCLSLLAVKS